MRILLFIAVIYFSFLTPKCYAGDNNLFFSICYRFLSEGSWGYNFLNHQ